MPQLLVVGDAGGARTRTAEPFGSLPVPPSATTLSPAEAMATELTVVLEDRPGALARLGTVLGDAGVNIEAIMVSTRAGEGFVRFVPRDAGTAARALDAAGLACDRREVVIVRVLDQPGALGELALVMAHAGINIDAVYVTTRGHVVLGVDDLDGATQVAGGMAVLAFD